MTTVTAPEPEDRPTTAEFGRNVAGMYPVTMAADAVAKAVERQARVTFGNDADAADAMLYAHSAHMARREAAVAAEMPDGRPDLLFADDDGADQSLAGLLGTRVVSIHDDRPCPVVGTVVYVGGSDPDNVSVEWDGAGYSVEIPHDELLPRGGAR